MRTAYLIASGLIITGFVMLCQPFTQLLFAWGFPVLLIGVILFLLLDHLPTPRPKVEETSRG